MAQQQEPEKTPEEKQEILMEAFKADRTAKNPDELYYWMKREYVDVCTWGDKCVNSMINKYHLEEQEKATEDELTFIWSLYDSFKEDYKEGEDAPHRPW
jgi:hypothetical protein